MPDNKSQNEKLPVNRRRMLFGAAAVLQAPLVLPGQAAAQEGGKLDQPADPRQPRYRETAHMRTFYELNKF